MSGLIKLLTLTFFFGCMILVLTWWQWPNDYAQVIFCDVDQGDATLIQYNSTQVLIDGGSSNLLVSECLGEYLPWWDRDLEMLIVTHADEDHYGGLTKVISHYQVHKILLTPWGKNNDDFRSFREAVLREESRIIYPKIGLKLNINQLISFTVLLPQVSESDPDLFSAKFTETELLDILSSQEQVLGNYNDLSIAILLEIGRVAFLLTGDIEQATEKAMLDQSLTPGANILKVAHHGSKTSSIDAFIQRVRPEISIISSGKNNQFGHPAKETLDKLTEIGSKILRTDQLGTIEVGVDGKKYWIEK